MSEELKADLQTIEHALKCYKAIAQGHRRGGFGEHLTLAKLALEALERVREAVAELPEREDDEADQPADGL